MLQNKGLGRAGGGGGSFGVDVRLTTHGQSVAARKLSVDRSNLFGDVREGFVEKLEALVFDFFEIPFGPLGEPLRVLEILVGCLESVLYHL